MGRHSKWQSLFKINRATVLSCEGYLQVFFSYTTPQHHVSITPDTSAKFQLPPGHHPVEFTLCPNTVTTRVIFTYYPTF